MSQKKNQNKYANSSIFIIDDEPIVTEIMKHHLAEAGFKELYDFNRSVDAMETLSLVKVDLIITDIEMPELGGKFLTKLARNTTHLKHTPIIVVSSDDSAETRNHVLGNGVQAILYKPIDQEELLWHVHKSLEQFEELKSESSKSRASGLDREKRLRGAFKR